MSAFVPLGCGDPRRVLPRQSSRLPYTCSVPRAGESRGWRPPAVEGPSRADSEPEDVVVLAPGPPPDARAPAGLLPQGQLADRHAPVDRLAHVVDRQRGD